NIADPDSFAMVQTEAVLERSEFTQSVESLLADETDLYLASRALKAMGHPLRLKILCILAGMKETSVQDLVDIVGTSQSNISQHLSILRDKGILASRKDANKVYYRIGDEKILALMGTMRDTFCNHEG